MMNRRAMIKRDTTSSDRETSSTNAVRPLPLPLQTYTYYIVCCIGADEIVRLLGQGTFGKVVEAVDTFAADPARRKVAIKVIRAVQKYRDASRVEIKVLKLLSSRDPDNLKSVAAPPR